MKAFLTGSHVYGTPEPDSDIDLVVLMDKATAFGLSPFSEQGELDETYGEFKGACLYFAKLNMIAVTDERDFEIWRQGTADLVARKPVTRDEAVAHFARLRKEATEAVQC